MTAEKAIEVLKQRVENDNGLGMNKGDSDYAKWVREQDEALNLAIEALEHPLLAFIKEEVPFRLREILGVPEEDIMPEVIDTLVNALWDDNDPMFDYDGLDQFLTEKLEAMGIEVGSDE